MTWLPETGVLLVTSLTLLLPGGLVALALGLRGFTALAAAAPFSMTAIGIASIVNIVVPFPWGLLPFLLATAALAALAYALRVIVRRVATPGTLWSMPPTRLGVSWPSFAAVAIAAICVIPRLMWVFDDPQSISQTFDNIYHLNGIRYIIDTGQAAPTKQLIPGFYPSAWHTLVALVVQITGASIPVAVNMTSITLGALVWPIGCVFLVQQIVGRQRAAVLATGVLSAGMGAFPLLILDFGVLYPNLLSIALLPAVLGALALVARLARSPLPSPIAWAMLLPWTMTLALAHPSTLMALFGLGIWPAIWGGVRYFRSPERKAAPRSRLVGAAMLWAAGLTVAAGLFVVARPTSAQAFWPPTTTAGEAILQVLTNSAMWKPPALLVSALMIAGIVTIIGWRRKHLWLVASFATLGFVYVVGVSFPQGWFRYLLTGTWYSDMFRVAALLPVVVIPLAAIGFAAVIALCARLVSPHRRTATSWWVVGSTSVGLLALLLTTQLSAPMSTATASARYLYVMTDRSPLLSTDEATLIGRLDQHVPPSAVIVGSPWTGTSLAYALAHRQVLVPHIYQMLDDDMATILEALNRSDSDPAVCSAVERSEVDFVLDFGPLEVHGAEHPFPGLENLEQSGAVELVDSEGDARLYRITACD